MNFLKSLLVALALSLSSWAAQAAVIYNFQGVVDPGSSLAGEPFSGTASFAAPPANPDDFVELISFSLNFLGQVYTQADSDPGFAPVAWFAGGDFIGIDFFDFDDSSRPSVALTADFFNPFFTFGLPTGEMGGGSVSFEKVVATVPLPGSLALAGLGLIGWGALARRRRA